MSDSKALHIARYLHRKGAKDYSAAEAVEVGDLERLIELLPDVSSEKGRKQACTFLRRCTYSGNAAMANFLFEQLGPGTEDAEDAFSMRVAMCLGERARMDQLASAEIFDINAKYLVARSPYNSTPLPYIDKAGWDRAEEEFIKTYRRTSSPMKYLQLEFPLKIAVQADNAEALSWVLAKGGYPNQPFDYDGRQTAISFALGYGSPATVVCLLQEGGIIPPWAASAAAAAGVLNAAMQRLGEDSAAKRLAMVEYLLKEDNDAFRAAMNVPSTGGKTPLRSACGKGDIALVRLLLENGACISEDSTAVASRSDAEKDEESLMMSVIISSRFLRQPAQLQQLKDLIRLLLEHGAPLQNGDFVLRLDFGQKEGACLPLLKCLYAQGVDVFAAAHDRTPLKGSPAGPYYALHEATLHAHLGAVKWLLNSGADPDASGYFYSQETGAPVLADDHAAVFSTYSEHYGDGYGGHSAEDRASIVEVKALFKAARRRKAAASLGSAGAGALSNDSDSDEMIDGMGGMAGMMEMLRGRGIGGEAAEGVSDRERQMKTMMQFMMGMGDGDEDDDDYDSDQCVDEDDEDDDEEDPTDLRETNVHLMTTKEYASMGKIEKMAFRRTAANDKYKSAEYGRAIELYFEAIRACGETNGCSLADPVLSSQLFKCWSNSAQCAMKLGQWARALKYSKEALEFSPETENEKAKVYFRIGSLCTNLRQHQKAASFFRCAFKISPGASTRAALERAEEKAGLRQVNQVSARQPSLVAIFAYLSDRDIFLGAASVSVTWSAVADSEDLYKRLYERTWDLPLPDKIKTPEYTRWSSGKSGHRDQPLRWDDGCAVHESRLGALSAPSMLNGMLQQAGRRKRAYIRARLLGELI
jgi:tetratricopeptide (TPR) repeat protein